MRGLYGSMPTNWDTISRLINIFSKFLEELGMPDAYGGALKFSIGTLGPWQTTRPRHGHGEYDPRRPPDSVSPLSTQVQERT